MEIVYENERFWITKDGKILKELGGFVDPVSPKIIMDMIENEI